MSQPPAVEVAGETPNPEAKKERPTWFVEELTDIDDISRDLFENYSKIPSDKVLLHIQNMRNQAFDIFPYPCLGHFRFLDLSIRSCTLYDEILERVKKGDIYLDIGCCFGQDIRKLVYDGAPSENTYGSDLRLDFMELGYDLFLDKDTLKTEFIAGDVFDADSPIKELDGKVDIIHAASFFHLFDWDEQVLVAKRVIKLLKPKAGSLVVGRQVGNIEAGHQTGSRDGKKRFRHNDESFKRLWSVVGEETGTKWEVNVRLGNRDIIARGFKPEEVPAGTQALAYTVRKL